MGQVKKKDFLKKKRKKQQHHTGTIITESSLGKIKEDT